MSRAKRLIVQGWWSIAFWMTLGLLLEGLLGYKAPSYLEDTLRRELFRLAHAHGTLLNLVMIVAAWSRPEALSRLASLGLSSGAVLIPSGFLLSGISHPEGDPGIAIWLVPPGAILMIYGVINVALDSHLLNSALSRGDNRRHDGD